MEFKDNSLSILTSSIHNIKNMKKNNIEDSLKNAEKLLNNDNLADQEKFLISQKIDALKSLNIN